MKNLSFLSSNVKRAYVLTKYNQDHISGLSEKKSYFGMNNNSTASSFEMICYFWQWQFSNNILFHGDRFSDR